jgi:cytochrome c oxidase assembly protein subunit 15
MVFIGGVTRLTDSGLSMVDWKPIMGAIPPLSEIEWQKAFDAYKHFPEYNLINSHFTLSEFKFIYFWEYFHRLMGRVVGIVFFFPFVYFLIRKRINGHKLKLGFAFILGGSQGLLGWYMVKSGLVDRPDVSHFRLAAHLGLAFVIIGYLFWIIFDMKLKSKISPSKTFKKFKVPVLIFLILLAIQIVYGAFVAGLDAGIGYNTWPLMGDSIIPRAAYRYGTFLQNIFYNPATIQFIHRTFAIIIFIFSLILFVKRSKLDHYTAQQSIEYIFYFVIMQFVLGVVTIIAKVPVSLGSLHQVMACILFLVTIRSVYILSRKTSV